MLNFSLFSPRVVFGFALAIILFIIFSWAWRYKIQPYLARKKMLARINSSLENQRLFALYKVFHGLYQNINSANISRAERKKLNLHDDAFVYGEIDVLAFWEILSQINLTPQDVFYDLGSGSGKAVFAVWLYCQDIQKSCGIELLPGLYQLACAQHQKLEKLMPDQAEKLRRIEFIQADMAHTDISDATVVFINATCLSYTLWQKILDKLYRLPSGARIIVTSKTIEHPDFKPVLAGRYLMSWGLNSAYVYVKK